MEESTPKLSVNPNRSSAVVEVQSAREAQGPGDELIALERVRSGDGELVVWGEIDRVRGVVRFHWENSSPGQTVLAFRVPTGRVPEYAVAPNQLKFDQNWTSGVRVHGIEAEMRGGSEADFVFETRQDIPFLEQVLSFKSQPEARYMNLVHMHVRMPEKPTQEELREIAEATHKTKKQIDLERTRKELEELTAPPPPPPDRVADFLEIIETELRLMETMDNLDDRLHRYEEIKLAAILSDPSLSREVKDARTRSIKIRVIKLREKNGI